MLKADGDNELTCRLKAAAELTAYAYLTTTTPPDKSNPARDAPSETDVQSLAIEFADSAAALPARADQAKKY